MTNRFRHEKADAAGWFLRGLRERRIVYEDAGRLENLFCAERISACDEAIFLDSEAGDVLALAIISKAYPAVWSYYTIPEHRKKGYGYELLVCCLERILEVHPDPSTKIYIEPISEGSRTHILRLPPQFRDRL